ncbi:PF20097 family protein [uncultured Robinsoniella sp.]|uniref:PF20097 family protein n=1 Tax=uncultured Robinsoniella sp. TaxID=904190 RepID=UPI00374F1567
MKCPYCNQEMENGYITSDAMAIAWRKEKFESAIVGRGDGVQLRRNFIGVAATIPNSYCCKTCQKIIIDYSEIES